MAYSAITNAEIDQDSPITQTLMTKYRDNIIFARNIIDFQEFLTSGTWNKPSDAASGDTVVVQIVGGGGSGNRAGSFQVGGGGGGGIIKTFQDVADFPASVDVVVGAGGASVTSGDGISGGDSSFGSAGDLYHLIARGGGRGDGGASTYEGIGGLVQANPWGVGLNSLGGEIYRGGSVGNSTLAQDNSDHSLFGGGAGGWIGGSFGFSAYAGNGGRGLSGADTISDETELDGQFPGGGGGGVDTDATGDTRSGAGANGVVRVWVIRNPS